MFQPTPPFKWVCSFFSFPIIFFYKMSGEFYSFPPTSFSLWKGEHFLLFWWTSILKKTLKNTMNIHFSCPSNHLLLWKGWTIKFSSIFNILLLGPSQNPHNLTIMLTKMEIIHVCLGHFNLPIVHYPFWICIISYSHYLCSDK